MSATNVAELLRLPAAQRLRLLELIWESLASMPAEVPFSDAHRAAIDEELDEHHRNPDDVLSLDEVLAAVCRAQ